MKKIIYKILIILLPIVSCNEDFIDLEPIDSLASNLAFQSLTDVEIGLLGAYSTLRATYDREYVTLPDITADNATQPTENLGQEIFQHNWQYAANDGTIAAIWANNYILIERANVVLKEVEIFASEDEAKADQIRGEALALRAIGHFDLMRYFSSRYSLTTDGSHLGVPIKTESGVISTPPRNTAFEVYEQIISDLTASKALLNGTDVGTKHRISELVVTGLLARVSLYRGEWQDAVNYAAEVIDAVPLSTQAQFQTMWTEDTEDEVLISVPFNVGETAIGAVLYQADALNVSGQDRLQWAPAADLLALYDQANDVRYSSYFQVRPATNNTDIVDNKYRGRVVGNVIANLELNDAKMLRVAEMYLIRAEANFNLNQGASAMADINDLRTARITGYVEESLTGAALEAAIQEERRKELAFEGHRWFDLKRLNQAVVRGQDCTDGPAVACSLDKDDFRVVFPIPDAEVFANDNMRQNDGY